MSNDIRILPLHAGVKDKLLDLKFNEKLVSWWRGTSKHVRLVEPITVAKRASREVPAIQSTVLQNFRSLTATSKQFKASISNSVQDNYFCQRGLTIQAVPHHGNCLFEVFAMTVYPNNHAGHLLVRRACIEHLDRNRSDFMPFILAPEMEAQNVNVAASDAAQAVLRANVNQEISYEELQNHAMDAYLQVMGSEGQYGGQVEIEAVRQRFKYVRCKYFHIC